MIRTTEVAAWAAAGDPRAASGIGWLLSEYEQHEERPMTLVFAVFGQQLAGDVAGALRVARLLAGFTRPPETSATPPRSLRWWPASSSCWAMRQGAAGSYLEKAASVTSPYDAASVGLVAAARCLLAGRAGDQAAAVRLGAEAVTTMRRTDQLWQTADVLRWVALSRALVWRRRRRARCTSSRRSSLYRHKEIVHWTRVVEERLAELRSVALNPSLVRSAPVACRAWGRAR